MKVLFDQGTPVPLRAFLSEHKIETAHEKGWSDLKNGDLLSAAEAEGFEAFITTDQNLRHQQNLSDRTIAIIVLKTTNWLRIGRHTSLVEEALSTSAATRYVEVDFPEL
jgi:hypothetical protein